MRTRSLKAFSLPLRLLQFLLSAFILGVFTYLIVRLVQNDSTPITRHRRTLTVEILAGVSTIYTLLLLLTTVLGHNKLFKFAILLDLVHVGALTAVAVLLRREGTRSCRRLFTSGSQRRDCNLVKTCFAFAVALAALFAITALLSFLLIRAHKRGAGFGPGPENGYSTKHNSAPHSRGKINPNLSNHNSLNNPNRASAISNDTAYTGSTLAAGHHHDGVMTHGATRKSAAAAPIGMATTTTGTGRDHDYAYGNTNDGLPTHPAPIATTMTGSYRSPSPLPPPSPNSYGHHMNHNPTVLSRPVDNTGGTQQPQYAYEPYRVPTPVLGSGNGNSRDTFGRREEVVEMPAGPGKGERGYF